MLFLSLTNKYQRSWIGKKFIISITVNLYFKGLWAKVRQLSTGSKLKRGKNPEIAPSFFTKKIFPRRLLDLSACNKKKTANEGAREFLAKEISNTPRVPRGCGSSQESAAAPVVFSLFHITLAAQFRCSFARTPWAPPVSDGEFGRNWELYYVLA